MWLFNLENANTKPQFNTTPLGACTYYLPWIILPQDIVNIKQDICLTYYDILPLRNYQRCTLSLFESSTYKIHLENYNRQERQHLVHNFKWLQLSKTFNALMDEF